MMNHYQQYRTAQVQTRKKQYLKKEVQDVWLVSGVAWGLHGNALLQTLSLLLLKQHLGDVLPQPLVGHVHTQLKYT